MIKYITKPKFRLRLKDNVSNTEAENYKEKVLKLNPDTKAKAKVVKVLRVAKEELSRAVKYCQDKNVCGYSAVKTGLFPSIKILFFALQAKNPVSEGSGGGGGEGKATK